MNSLGQVSPLHRRAELKLSLTVLFPQKTADKGGFAGAVVAQNGNTLPCLHIQLNAGKNHPFSKRFADIFHFEHHIAGKILFRKGGFHVFFRFGSFRLLNALHAVLNGHRPAIQGSVIDAPALHSLNSVAQLLQLGLLLKILLHLQIKPGLLFIHVE